MILIEPFISDLNCLYFIAMLGAIRVLNSATSRTVFYVRRRSGPVSSRQGNEMDLRLFLLISYFLAGFADFLVGDAPKCRVQ